MENSDLRISGTRKTQRRRGSQLSGSLPPRRSAYLHPPERRSGHLASRVDGARQETPASRAIHSNLFDKIPQKFDLITFNAPYLPEDPREPKDSQVATTGGPRGDEISVEFLDQAKSHLNKEGKIFLLISSLTPMDKIKKFNPKIVSKKKIFMEELIILEIS